MVQVQTNMKIMLLFYMKNFSMNKKLMWVLLLIAAILGSGMISYQVVSDWKALPEAEKHAVLAKSEVEEIATNFINEHFKIDTASFSIVSTLTTDPLPDTFLMKSYLSPEEQITYRDMYLSAGSKYLIRFYKAEQIEEYFVSVDAFRGEIIDFEQTLPEDTTIEEASASVAMLGAQEFVSQITGAPIDKLSILSKYETTFPGGIERNVTFAWQGTEVDSEFGEGFVTFDTTIRGNIVSSFTPSYEYPEPFERVQDKGGLVGFGTLLEWFIIIVGFIPNF